MTNSANSKMLDRQNRYQRQVTVIISFIKFLTQNDVDVYQYTESLKHFSLEQLSGALHFIENNVIKSNPKFRAYSTKMREYIDKLPVALPVNMRLMDFVNAMVYINSLGRDERPWRMENFASPVINFAKLANEIKDLFDKTNTPYFIDL